MINFNISFTDDIKEWKHILIENLKENNIDYNDSIITNILNSINYKINKYLLSIGYKPKNSITYRKDLEKRLYKKGLFVWIRSNKLLGKYLEYFTDIEDYTKCFDVEIKVIDRDKLSKNMYFVQLRDDNRISFGADLLNHSEKYLNLVNNLELLKEINKNKQDKTLNIIIDIFEGLLFKED